MKKSNSLFWKIFCLLFGLLFLLGIFYLAISTYTAKDYFRSVNQKLNGGIAAQMVKEVKPLVNGEVDTLAIQDIMHSMMVINPSVEVYLLNTSGEIITYVAPYKKIKLKKVSLAPIKEFLKSEDEKYILGDDPRFPGEPKVFSTAAINESDNLSGYIYIILASEQQASIINTVLGNYNLKYGSFLFLVSLIIALLLGALALWYITKNIRGIIDTVRRFKDGDYSARIDPKSSGDLNDLSVNFNAMADQLVSNMNQQKDLENLRRELIANISHDLRTPLSIIQGYAETMLMKKEELSEEDKTKFLKIMIDSSENVNSLVNQLFEYSKLEAKQVEAVKEPFSLAELVNDLFMKYQILAKEKNHSIEIKQSNDLPLVFADVSLVERVIQNLLDNAIKFTPEGGKIILELNTSNDFVQCNISDNGVGISEFDQAHIFERYHRSERVKKPNGAGLGLAIAKKIMEIHESTLRVKSKLNEGTSFIFDLPIYQEQMHA